MAERLLALRPYSTCMDAQDDGNHDDRHMESLPILS